MSLPALEDIAAHSGTTDPIEGLIRVETLQPHVQGPLRLFTDGLPQRLPAAATGFLTHRYSDLSRRFKPQRHLVRRLVSQQFKAHVNRIVEVADDGTRNRGHHRGRRTATMRWGGDGCIGASARGFRADVSAV